MSTTDPTPAPGRLSLRGGRVSGQDALLLGVLVAMVALFSVLNPRFFSTAALANVLQDWAPLMLLAIAQTYVIITAGIDLSVGATLGLSGVMCALVIRALDEAGTAGYPALAAGVATALAVGALVGVLNGLLVTKAGLAPFIATLATLGAGSGLTLVITGGVQVAGAPTEVITFGNQQYLQVLTLPLVAVLVILALAWVVLSQSRFGRWTHAIGSNAFAARSAGIGVEGHLIKIYSLSGILAALAGVFVYLRLGSGSPTSGRGQELNAIAATVIGGASLFGGRGRLSGTVLGALITATVLSGLIVIGVAPNWQQVVVGVLIAGAVIVQQLGTTRERRGIGTHE